MVRAERLLLKAGRFAQEALSGVVVAGRGRLFGGFVDRAGPPLFRHPVSRKESESRERQQLAAAPRSPAPMPVSAPPAPARPSLVPARRSTANRDRAVP